MQVIVSDTSCLIDLKKVSLIEAFLLLPYEIIMPDILFAEEIIRFTHQEKAILEGGLRITSISGNGVLRAIEIQSKNRKLSINDCFAFVLAESISNSILLTGDKRLRNLANNSGLEFRGVIWIIEQIYEANLVSHEQLYLILLEWKKDKTVRLPEVALDSLIEKFKPL
jgi:predicted nucleic acid-binding protein